jgi:hypothetical protein
MTYSFWIESGDVWVADSSGVVWHGRPDGYPALSVIPLPGTGDAIVLLDWMAGPLNACGQRPGFPNLVRLTPEGRVVWRADPAVQDKDFWVAVRWRDCGLYGNTWSCYYIHLDPETGRELSRVFTK